MVSMFAYNSSQMALQIYLPICVNTIPIAAYALIPSKDE